MNNAAKLQVVVITGMSGAGKTKAVDWFEDQGYYCIDNMPPSLIKNFLELTKRGVGTSISKCAFVVDIRSDEFFLDLRGALTYLSKEPALSYKILFIEASDTTLIRRYNESRRNHPLTTGATSAEIIERERKLLEELRRKADYVVDTTNLKVSDFNKEMSRLFTGEGEEKVPFAINLKSFGYKYGLPQEADFVFDMRFIPNPFYVPSLRNLTGNNKKVSRYVIKSKVAQEFIRQITELIDTLAPNFVEEGKYHINVAIGCTGGQHRSVAMANELARIFIEKGYRVNLEHREQ